MAVPFDQRPDLIWFDGQLVPTSDAKVNVLTHGLHYASAVFEGERAYGGEIFKLHRAFGAAEAIRPASWTSRFPISVAEIDAAKRLLRREERHAERLCPRHRLARLRGARRRRP